MHGPVTRRRMSMRFGLTFSEILLVLSVVVILVLSILPSVGRAGADTRAAALGHNLKALRTQLEIYRYNHQDIFPTTAVAEQLTSRTDLSGTVSAHGSCGPYFANGIPSNPFNSRNDILVKSPLTQADADGSSAWLYDPNTCTIVPGDSVASYTAFDGP